MKSAVETLEPTRVRLTVEVPFDELRPSLDSAYKRIAQQVALPGFRKGKVPPRLIDQRFGRGVVLEEAVNEALPRFYSQAVRDNDVHVLGQPEVDVTQFADGEQLTFTAEVDVRPEVTLPDYDGIEVTVDPATVAEEDVEGQLRLLAERFGTLNGVDRPAADGDFVSLDLTATVDGQEIDAASGRGLSYQVGSGALLPGLDDAVTGLAAGESATFTTVLVGGDFAGKEAEVTATVTAVKERSLPELDDEFAQLASEFDTIAELRDSIRDRLVQVRRFTQGEQARDRVLEALLERVQVPLPERVVEEELRLRRQSLDAQLEEAEMSLEDFLSHEGQTEEEFTADLVARTRQAITAQFVLEAVARKEQVAVAEGELTEHLLRRALQARTSPDVYAQQVVEAGQVPLLVNEVTRGKALALLLERAVVTDTAGNRVDLDELLKDRTAQTVAADEDAGGEAGEPAEEAVAAPERSG